MEHKHTLLEEKKVLLAQLHRIARLNTETHMWEATEHAMEKRKR